LAEPITTQNGFLYKHHALRDDTVTPTNNRLWNCCSLSNK